MSAEKVISIIVPVYNIKEYLNRCVQSILKQTYQNIEVILIDDGSTDGSSILCDELGKKDARIKVFHKENGGSSTARNMGLEKATGDFVGFVDSDDYIAEDMYANLIIALQSSEHSIAQIARTEIDENGAVLPDICVPPKKEIFYTSEEFMRELLLHKGDASLCTKLFEKNVFLKRRFPVGKLNEDFILLIDILLEYDGVITLPQRGYHVFYKLGSNTRNKSADSFSSVYKDTVDNADRTEKVVLTHYPRLTKEMEKFGLFTRLLYLLHIPIGKMTKDNKDYREIIKYIRKKWNKIITSPFLTSKDKVYLLLFCIAPKQIRKLHRKLKHKAL